MTKRSLKIRPATRDDMLYFYKKPASSSVRAWVCQYSGQDIGIGGIVLVEGSYTAFLQVKRDLVVPKVVLWRAIKLGMIKLCAMNIRLLAIRDCNLESSNRLLKKLGFSFLKEVDGSEVYIR